jgi:prolyl 4-hydroxylase
LWYTLIMEILSGGSGHPYVRGDALDQSGPLVFAVPGVLDAAACAAWIEQIERLGPAPAPITTPSGFAMRPDIRNNTRVMFDDPALAAALFARLGPALPARLFDGRPVGVNERVRCYRYAPGQRFAPHYDGAFERSRHERSELTLMVYLNEGFEGGTTAFLELGVEATPRTGMALLFQHRLLHEGCAVRAGVKYVLRTDVMYADG